MGLTIAPSGAIFLINICVNTQEQLQWALKQSDTTLDCISISANTIYLPTLKCANTWCQDLLLEQGYTKTKQRTAERVLIVTRDPIERWVSGITTYLRIWHKADQTVTALRYSLDQLLSRTLTPDLHTAPQSLFVQHLDPEQLLGFSIADLEQNFPKYLNIVVEPNRYRNSTTQHNFMSWAHEIVLPLADKYRTDLMQIYRADYELIQRITQ